MAIFLGTRGDDILAWRGVADLLTELRGVTAGRMTSLLSEDVVALLKAFKQRLEEEIAFEENFAAEFGRAVEQLDHAASEDDFSRLLDLFSRLAREHFLRRGSVVAIHAFCNAYQDGLIRAVLQRVEEELKRDGTGRPPAPYCLLAEGSAGRLEQTLCVDSAYQLIHGGDEDGGTDYFMEFARRAALLLGKAGLLRVVDSGELSPFWRCGRKEWRDNNLAAFSSMDQQGLALLLKRADFRLVHGDEALAEEMIRVVGSLIDFRRGELRSAAAEAASSHLTRAAISFPAPGLRDLGKSITETPSGLDFFGRLKVEKGGRRRGRFDLEQYALAPLVANVRMMAIEFGVPVTGTIARIKELQGAGRLSVELSDRLLRAYHEFTRLKILHQIAEGCGSERTCYIDPRKLTEEEDQRLRGGLESVADLEKIAYLSFMEQ